MTALPPPERIPVIVGVGEVVDRPERVEDAREPARLMADALHAADADAGGGWLARLDSLEAVGLVSWRYADPVGRVCEMAGVSPARRVNASMGGETPVRLIHEAALAISRGEATVAAIVGGEAQHARAAARKAGVALDWTREASREDTVRVPGSSLTLSPATKALGVRDPASIYPLFETAAHAAWGQTPAEADAESAALWARYARVAADNPSAWIRAAPDAASIAEVRPDNRMIAWPYPKLMAANPNVNQAAAILVTSLAAARAAGVAEDRLVHVWGGAAAAEAEDILQRPRLDRSTTQAAVLEAAAALAGGAETFDVVELYSCFPVVPKMARRTLGLGGDGPEPTVAGGLTFFGGPLNNYMSHATAAMVRRLRKAPGALGLLYGQGGVMTKHHALVLGSRPAPAALSPDVSVQARADAAADAAPPVVEGWRGAATVEAYTARFGREGAPLDGVVIARTADGARAIARVPPSDDATMALLLSREASAVGAHGRLEVDVFGQPVWRSAAALARPRSPTRFIRVERDGPVTLVVIDRPEAMNALHPPANGELAEAFNAFAADPDQAVAILTGAGDRAFCAGNDLKWTAVLAAQGLRTEVPLTGFAGLTSRFDLDKPVIAAVNGLALGGGFEIALACDLIVAAETAAFALPEPKVGLVAAAGGVFRLPQQIGQKAAMGMILTGRQVPAREGLALGFVNEVVAHEDLLDTARRWAAQIVACSPLSIRASKSLVRLGLDSPSLAGAFAAMPTNTALKALYASPDVVEGPTAFAQKRPPRWSRPPA